MSRAVDREREHCTWLLDHERAQHEATKSTLEKAWADLDAERQMREETRVLLDQALTERDDARQSLNFDWNKFVAPGGCDLVAAYQAWLDWYKADKGEEEGTLSHELARQYVVDLILELRKARQQLADAPHDDDCRTLFEERTRLYADRRCDCWKAGL